MSLPLPSPPAITEHNAFASVAPAPSLASSVPRHLGLLLAPLPKAVEDAHILGIVDAVLEVELAHLEERGCSQQRVASGLVARADPLEL